MTYEYECSNIKCNYKSEEIQGMTDKKFTKCPICKKETFHRLISRGENIIAAKIPLYDFVDYKTTGKPIRINGKNKWKEHLEKIGQIEAPNDPPTQAQINSVLRTKKMVAKKELRETIVKAVQDKKHINETKNKILHRKGG